MPYEDEGGECCQRFYNAFIKDAGVKWNLFLAGALIVIAAQILKTFMKWVTIGMRGILILLGILMLFGKNLSVSFNLNSTKSRSETAEAFIFGVAYAIGALGCLFPLFLVVATQAMAAPSALLGASYIGAYFVGISLMMIIAIMLSTFARDMLMKYLRKILPHMEQLTGGLLVFAVGYVIYYQMVLI